jgi:hyperosmotically inducible periplasmic protein
MFADPFGRLLCHVFMRAYVFRTSSRSTKEDFPKMRRRITGLIALAVLSIILPGCNGTANNNTNGNANLNANVRVTPSPTPTANANTGTAESRRAPTREEYERDKERYQREAKESGRTVGTGLNDGWLWVKTRFDLAAADDLRDSTINVDVANAVVTLSGTVASAAQKTRADQVAKSVEGVKSVRNQLKVQTGNANANANANGNRNRNANR